MWHRSSLLPYPPFADHDICGSTSSWRLDLRIPLKVWSRWASLSFGRQICPFGSSWQIEECSDGLAADSSGNSPVTSMKKWMSSYKVQNYLIPEVHGRFCLRPFRRLLATTAASQCHSRARREPATLQQVLEAT
eukprot:2354380-Amphidinium_carterae.2